VPDEKIKELLATSKTIAVVGLSSNPDRPSHGVAKYLQSHGYKVIPVNPNEAEVLGEKSYASLRDIPEKVDIVDVFRAVDAVPAITDDAIAIGAKALWLQLGIVHEEAAAKARTAGLQVIQDQCLAVDHRLLMRS
jgi:predicted CoA-binding protein